LGCPSTHEPDTSEIPNLRRGPATCGALILSACVRLSHLRRLEFRDNRYTRDRLLGHIDDDRFNHGVLGDFLAFTFFRVAFAPRLSVALADGFRDVAFAPARFAGLFRVDLEGLRPLRRATDFAFRFRTAGSFFR